MVLSGLGLAGLLWSGLSWTGLCCVVWCCAVLGCAVLCCAVLCCAGLAGRVGAKQGEGVIGGGCNTGGFSSVFLSIFSEADQGRRSADIRTTAVQLVTRPAFRCVR